MLSLLIMAKVTGQTENQSSSQKTFGVHSRASYIVVIRMILEKAP